jgi:hypothetical protein
MNVVRNAALIRNRVRIASASHLAALVCFAGGLFVSNSTGDLVVVYATMVVGLALYAVGQHLLRRWGPRYRYDGLLVQALKGLDKRYTFAAFVDPKLPDYMIVGPQGIVPIVAQPQGGTVFCRSDQWGREKGKWGLIGSLFTPSLKNPSADAQRAAQQVRTFMSTRLGESTMSDLPIQPTVVFIHPQVRLRIDGCSVPVTSAKELRAHLRRAKPVVSAQVIAAVTEAWQSSIN